MRRSASEDSTGMKVSDKISDALSAMMMVMATGENSLPSRPWSESNGRNTRQMITMPEATGKATPETA